MRHTWLLQVAFTARMLESHAHPASEHPMPELRRAQDLLLRIIQQQVHGLGNGPFIRPGSSLTWHQYRLRDFDASSTLSYDPDIIFDSSPIDPADEEFPESDESMKRIHITSEVRHARLRVLQSMRSRLHFAREDRYSPMEAIRQLWDCLMAILYEGVPLRVACGCEEAVRKWFRLRMEDRETFLQSFTFAKNAPEPHILYQLTHASEARIFIRTLDVLDDQANTFILGECEKAHCDNPWAWFDIVREAPKEDCPICMEQYQPPNPLWDFTQQISDRTAHMAIELRCKHIICLPCFINWVWSDNHNSGKCPHCCADLSPPNPALEWSKQFNEKIAFLVDNTNLSHPLSLQDLLSALNTYISKLPDAVKNIELTDADKTFDHLLAWRDWFLAAPANVAADFREDQPSEEQWQASAEYIQRLAFDNVLFSLARLQAFVDGDMNVYNNLCKRQVIVRTEFETRSFALAMHE
jgi:hypothetical protein